MPKPNTLSHTAQAVLAAAAARDDHFAFPPDHLPTAARRAVVQSLLKAGLLEVTAATDDDDAAWRTTDNGEQLVLRATTAGLAAIGALVSDQPADVQLEASMPLPARALTSVPVPVARLTIRAAARAVLTAWDDADANRPALPAAIEALRAILAPRQTRTLPGTPRQPRPDTKRALVLALLGRPEGATIAHVATATGWATHTVRGFFAGLNKAGISVDVLERVRQVGPGKEGAKGSYTVYRVAEAP